MTSMAHVAAAPAEIGVGLPSTSSRDEAFRTGRPEVTLSIDDLILDGNGEVVLFNDSGFRSLELIADSMVIGQGMVESHVTEAGDDVSGFQYVTFTNGLTLFHDPQLTVVVRHIES